MNRNLYRIVFNGKYRLAFSLQLALGLATILPAGEALAQAVAYKAAPANQRPIILKASNGVPVVDIQTPSAAGVSRNTYSQFDVNADGLILNNSRNNVATQLAGWIQGNPWLAKGTARVILNEVIAGNPSLLGGYVEVGGDKAQVIIANPAGITCSGCGFLNASRATLTTGTPIFSAGVLDGYHVQGGLVRVDGNGMDARQADATEIIARAVEINAGLWAQDLRLTTGANRVDAESVQATPIDGTGEKPVFAVDVAQLGGMYAQRIHLIGTEAGVGVRNAGTLAASAGEVIVTADGRLTHSGLTLGADTRIDVAGIDNSGTLAGERNLALNSRNDVANTGLFHAGEEIRLEVDGQLNNSGRLEARRIEFHGDALDNSGALRQNGEQGMTLLATRVDNAVGARIGNIVHAPDDGQDKESGESRENDAPSADGETAVPTSAIDGGEVGLAPDSVAPDALPLADGLIAVRGELVNTGEIVASGSVALESFETLRNAGTLALYRLSAAGNLLENRGDISAVDAAVTAATLDNRGGALTVANRFLVAARKFDNNQGSLRHTGTDALILPLDELDNRNGQIASNGDAFALTAASLDNRGGQIAHTGSGALTLAADRLDNRGGQITGNSALSVGVAGKLDNGQGVISGQTAVTVTAGGDLANADGRIIAGGDLKIRADAVDNAGGALAAVAGELDLATLGAVDNAKGRIEAGGALTLDTRGGALDNREGGIVGQDALRLLAGAVDNRGGRIEATGILDIVADSIDNHQGGRIVSGAALNIDMKSAFDNSGGILSSQRALTLMTGGNLANADGQIVAGSDLKISAAAVDNAGGMLGAVAGRLDLSASGVIDNTNGRIEAGGALTLTGAGLDNVEGAVLGQTLTLDTRGGALDNSGGLLAAEGALKANSGELINKTGQIQAGGALDLAAASLANTGGVIQSLGDIDAKVRGHFDNQGGRVEADGKLNVAAGSVDNRQGGRIVSAAALDIGAEGALDNSGGILSGQTTLTLAAGGDLANVGGQIVAGSDLNIAANAVDNTDGLIGAVAGDVELAAADRISNANGRIEASGALALTGTGLDNTEGAILGQTLQLDTQSGALDNTAGLISADQALALAATSLANVGGVIQSLGDIDATVNEHFDNRGGKIETDGKLNIAAGSIDNRQDGRIVSAAALDIGTEGALDNSGGILSSQAALTLAAGGDLANVGGQIVAGSDLGISANAVDNSDGLIGAIAGDVELAAADRIGNANGQIEAFGALTLAGTGLDNTAGLIQAGGALDLDTRGAALANQNAGRIIGLDVVTLRAGAMDNTQGLISAERTLALTADSLHNVDGLIQALADGGAASTLAIQGAFDNRGGKLSANHDLEIRAQNLDNRSGQIIGKTLDLATTGAVNNGAGILSSQGALTLAAGADLANVKGQIVAETDLQVTAHAVDNTEGTLGAVGGKLDLVAAGRIGNVGGRLEAFGPLTLTGTGLDNTQGSIIGQTLLLDTRGGALDNIRGLLAAEAILTARSGRFDNTDGLIQAGGEISLDTQGAELINRNTGGNGNALQGILGQQAVRLAAGALDNRGGLIGANGDLAIGAAGDVNNGGGRMLGNGFLTLTAGGEVANAGGTLSSGAALTLAAGRNLTSTGGQIVAGGDLQVEAQNIGNVGGTLAAVAGKIDFYAHGDIDNRGGRIEADGDLTLVGERLDNSGSGLLFGQTLDIASRGRIDNQSGRIVAEGALVAEGSEIDNSAGLIQSGSDLALKAQSGALINANTRGSAQGILSQGAMRLTAGRGIDNSAGRIGAPALTLDAASLTNAGGEIQALTGIDARLSGALDNTGGLLRADAVRITAGSIGNRNTLGANQGIEGSVVKLSANTLDNTRGALRADRLLELAVGGTLDNTSGLISSLGTLNVKDSGVIPDGLTLINTGGTLIADEHLSIDAARATQDGQFLSGQDLSLKLKDDVSVGAGGRIAANRNLTIETTRTIENDGRIEAGNALTLTAQALTNNATGTLTGKDIDLSVSGQLTNRGLINSGNAGSGEARLAAAVLDNLGGGRIYGDHLAIAAGTVNNLAEGGSAPVIAARERLDLGVGTLNNHDEALIFSAGDLFIGGGLDAQNRAVGQSTALDNASATIEALGDLTINTASLSNYKRVFETAQIQTNEFPAGVSLLDYVPELYFYWTIEETNPINWRNFVRDRYIGIIADLLGGGLDTAYRGELAALINAQPRGVYEDSRAIWNLLIGKMKAERPEDVAAMERAVMERGVPQQAHGQICKDDDCDYIHYLTTSYTTYRDVVTADSPAAVIRSGGDMRIDTTMLLDNRYSLIQSGGNMRLTGSSLSNTGAEFYLVTDTTTIARKIHWVDRDHGSTTNTERTQSLVDSAPAIISAGGLLTGSFTDRIDNLTIRQNAGRVTGQGSAPANVGAGAIGGASGADAARIEAGATTTRAAQTQASNTDAGSVARAARTSEADFDAAAMTQAAHAADAGFDAAAVQREAGTLAADPTLPSLDAASRQATAARTDIVRVSAADGPAALIATARLSLALPANQLYHTDPNRAGVLIETDPLFTNFRKWLSSDYMLNALGADPAWSQKRLGDGFYEQQLITEQIGELTGRRFLEGYASDEEQYRALMNAGLTYAREWQLIPGVALSAEQMAHLTTDMVWLVERAVTLADGTVARVLVPQVYARVREGDLAPSGALIAANDIRLDTTGDLVSSGTIAGREVVLLTAENIELLRGRVSGSEVLAQANTDLNVLGGTIEAEHALIAAAGRDLTIESSTVDWSVRPPEGQKVNAAVEKSVIDRVAGLYVTGENGTLVAAAGRDLTLLAAALVNSAPATAGSAPATAGTTLLSAGRDLTLGTVTETSNASTSSKGNRWTEATAIEAGSLILAGGDLTLAAGSDLLARAASVTALGDLAASAGRDLTITAGDNHLENEIWHKSKKRGVLSSRTRERLDTLDETTAIASLFSGDTVTLTAGQDLTVQGSHVVATGDLTALAGRDLTLATASETH
ncbi:MAG: filamentous hemagglutinin N-terminal domain-containing protein, partial [Zoogloeaceae bacterium]|nr:filamentous hemagglutinin N-terminal domain-containing protein [Zoogloeaceae bacterium]